jgi:hypothetical protein
MVPMLTLTPAVAIKLTVWATVTVLWHLQEDLVVHYLLQSILQHVGGNSSLFFLLISLTIRIMEVLQYKK